MARRAGRRRRGLQANTKEPRQELIAWSGASGARGQAGGAATGAHRAGRGRQGPRAIERGWEEELIA
eukprot:6717781-Alexandrium_andersonii.AAC.1